MIVFKKEQINQIINHCKDNLPNESCGILAGIMEEGKKIITHVYLLENIDKSPDHFSMDVKEQFQVISDIRKKDLLLMGNFHSHPSTPSRPSLEDIRLAFDPNLSYVILSLADIDHPVLNSFTIRNNTVTKDQLEVVE